MAHLSAGLYNDPKEFTRGVIGGPAWTPSSTRALSGQYWRRICAATAGPGAQRRVPATAGGQPGSSGSGASRTATRTIENPIVTIGVIVVLAVAACPGYQTRQEPPRQRGKGAAGPSPEAQIEALVEREVHAWNRSNFS